VSVDGATLRRARDAEGAAIAADAGQLREKILEEEGGKRVPLQRLFFYTNFSIGRV